MLSLLIIGAIPWFLILLYLISRRSFTVLLVWLLIAPMVTFFVERSGRTVVYETSGSERTKGEESYYEHSATITVQKLIKPTRILVGLFLLVLLLNTMSKTTRLITLDTTEKWMSIFALILIVNVFWRSERLAFALHVAVDAFIVPFLVYYFTRRLVTSQDRFCQLVRIIGYMGVYVIALALIERFTTPDLFHRVRGPFESFNTLHPIIAVVFFIAMINPLHDGRPALACLARRVILYLGPIVVALTLTRGNWLGFLSGLAIFLVAGRRLVSFRRELGAVGIVPIFAVIAPLCLLLLVPESFIDHRVTRSDNLLGRFATWIATIQLAVEAPILGVGLNNLHGLLRSQTVSFGEFLNYTTPHNSYLSILVELGVLGVIAYSAIIATIIKSGLNLYRTGTDSQDRWRGVALVCSVIAYQTPSLFANTMYIPGLIHLYVYVFAGAIAGLYGSLQPVSKQYAVPWRAAYQPGYARQTWGRRSLERHYER